MAKVKYDGVVEAVHYKPDGQIDWVRAYLRRGFVFTDRTVLDRQVLIEHLKSGKRYMAGQRIPLLGATFDVTKPLQVSQKDGNEILVTGETQADQDHLEGVPVI